MWSWSGGTEFQDREAVGEDLSCWNSVRVSDSTSDQKPSHVLQDLSSELRKSVSWWKQGSFPWFYSACPLDGKRWEEEKKTVLCHSCHSSSTETTTGNEQIAPISRHLLAVGLILPNKCRRFVSQSSLPPFSLCNSRGASLGCKDNTWFPSRKNAELPADEELPVCVWVCVLVIGWDSEGDVWWKMYGMKIPSGSSLFQYIYIYRETAVLWMDYLMFEKSF